MCYHVISLITKQDILISMPKRAFETLFLFVGCDNSLSFHKISIYFSFGAIILLEANIGCFFIWRKIIVR